MRFFRSLIIISLLFLSLSVTGVQAQSTSEKTIEKKVFKEILSLPFYDVFDAISFDVKGDTVILSGKVVLPQTKSSAEKFVKKVDGVKTVVNNIEVLPFSGFDNQIRRQALRQLADTGGLYRYLLGVNPALRIIVQNGDVTLEGVVNNRGDERLAIIQLRQIFGVFDVKSNLKIERER